MRKDEATPVVLAPLFSLLLSSFASAQGVVLHSRPECEEPTPPSSACWSDFADVPVEGFALGRENDVYASYALDAIRSGCAETAARRLEQRLRDTLALYGATANGLEPKVRDPRSGALVHPFQSWLAGAVVTHVFNAAWELRRRGIAVDDGLLVNVEAIYADIPVPQDPSCGLRSLPSVNSCMDDFALTASGHAWVAAYESAAGRDADADPAHWLSRGRGFIAEALSPMSEHGGGPCFFAREVLEDGTVRARCDASLSEGRVMGADHGRENPGYGLGLMTSVASACAALFFAGARCSFSEDEAAVSRDLFRHAQEKASPDGSAFNGAGPGGCLDFSNLDGDTKPCSDEDTLVWSSGGYRPSDFPVRLFYAKRGISGMHDGPAFQFDEYCEPRTTWKVDEFWGPARRVFYERLAWDIFR